jgi:Tfp pilus assembly protein PilV
MTTKVLVFALLAVTGSASALGAQQQIADAGSQLKNDCRIAAQTVESGAPESRTEWAFNQIALCGAEAASAVASSWSTTMSGNLVRSRETCSARIADARVLAAVVTAGTSATRSPEERISALAVMTQLLQPGRFIGAAFWENPEQSSFGFNGDLAIAAGDQPISATEREGAVRALEAMAASARDPQGARVARRLVALLKPM